MIDAEPDIGRFGHCEGAGATLGPGARARDLPSPLLYLGVGWEDRCSAGRWRMSVRLGGHVVVGAQQRTSHGRSEDTGMG